VHGFTIDKTPEEETSDPMPLPMPYTPLPTSDDLLSAILYTCGVEDSPAAREAHLAELAAQIAPTLTPVTLANRDAAHNNCQQPNTLTLNNLNYG
jgi:hypothetical protein